MCSIPKLLPEFLNVYKFLRFSLLFVPLYIESSCYRITQLSGIALVLTRWKYFILKGSLVPQTPGANYIEQSQLTVI